MIQKPRLLGLDGQELFSLDSPLTQEGVSDLVDRSVDRLLEVDSPSLETMKMQVAVDSSYITEEDDLIKFYQRRNTRLREMQRAIAIMRPKDGADFDALTALHRQVNHVGSDISHIRKSCRVCQGLLAHYHAAQCSTYRKTISSSHQ